MMDSKKESRNGNKQIDVDRWTILLNSVFTFFSQYTLRRVENTQDAR